jgi:two-component system sensor kinase FixL
VSLSVSRLFIRLVGLLASLAIAVQTVSIISLVLERKRRRRAEVSLQRSEKRMRLIAEASPNGTILAKPEGQIVWANPSAEKLVGYTRDELVGKSIDLLIPERFRGPCSDSRARFLSLAAARRKGTGQALLIRRKDGSELPVEVELSEIEDSEGALFLAVVVDVSARTKAESEAQQYRDELAHFTRVEILGQMAGSLAHELNQPLSSIMNNANAGRRFIATGRGGIAKIDELLTAVVADARRAGSIIRGIRGLVRKGEGERSFIDVNRIVEDVLQLVHSDALKRHCKVEAELTPGLPMVKVNPVLIQQVLLNIIVNAFDAMSDTVEEQRRVIIRSELTGFVKVSVRDFGRGLPSGGANRIFDHFFSTKPKGLGMGLAIARSIIISHGGELGADNAEGGGALVYFSLPAAGNDSTASPPSWVA